MEEVYILQEIRLKTDKTKVEEMLLEYHRKLATICEIVISESKWHKTPKQAIEEIRNIL